MNVRGEAEGVEEEGERQKDTRSARALADTEVEVSSDVVSVASLHPSIEEFCPGRKCEGVCISL
jgi:hypothetical protein